MRTHYDNLHVSEKASPEVIKGAYKALAQKWHPDKHPDQREKAERYFKIITRAFEVLSDSKTRAEYDAWLTAQRKEQSSQPEPEPAQEPPKHQKPNPKPFPTPEQNMEEAREDGRRSREQGFSESDCPYSGDLATAWLQGFAAVSPSNINTADSWVGRLWRGEEGLAKTFWLYGVAGFVVVFVVSIFLATLITGDRTDAAAIIRLAQNFYIAYFIFISICVARAFSYSRQRTHAPTPQQGSQKKPITRRLIDGEIKIGTAIFFGAALPTLTVSVLAHTVLEKPDAQSITIRVGIICAAHAATAVYIIRAAFTPRYEKHKTLIVGIASIWAFLALQIATSL